MDAQASASPPPSFAELNDLSCEDIGGRVIFATDDWFARRLFTIYQKQLLGFLQLEIRILVRIRILCQKRLKRKENIDMLSLLN